MGIERTNGPWGAFTLLAVPLAVLLTATCTMDFDSFGYAGAGPTGGIGGSGGTITGGSTATGGVPNGGAAGQPLGGGGSGPTGGTGGAGGSCDFTAPDTCDSAEQLTSVRGDAQSDSETVTGIGSKWFEIEIAESAGPGNPLSYTAELTVPGGMDYDLYVYPGDIDSGSPNCGATPLPGSGNPEAVNQSWDDSNFGPNNDERWLSIEVRYVSGSSCTPGSEWSLTVSGNT